jgi:hypothetical protein
VTVGNHRRNRFIFFFFLSVSPTKPTVKPKAVRCEISEEREGEGRLDTAKVRGLV